MPLQLDGQTGCSFDVDFPPPPDEPWVFWLTVWSGTELKFNTDKCEVMRISKKNDYSSPQYHLCGNQLKAVSEVKDLGIYITSNLS